MISLDWLVLFCCGAVGQRALIKDSTATRYSWRALAVAGTFSRIARLTLDSTGITNPPGNPAYNASKSALKTLTEHLSYDIRHTSTSVHLLVPGSTFTGLSGGGPDSAKEKPSGSWWPSQVAEYLEQKMSEGKFYVLCPDGDVTEDLDRRRMLWAVGDLVYQRPALSRWREESKDEAAAGIQNLKY